MRINVGCVLNLLILSHLVTAAAAADETVDKARNATGDANDGKAVEVADAEILAMNKELTTELEGQLKALPAIVDTDADAVGKYSRRGWSKTTSR
jgi:hypothetical protein